MTLRDYLESSVELLARNRGHVIGSAMAVVWGTATIIVLLSAGAGFRQFMTRELTRFGRGAIMVYPSVTSSGFPGYRRGVPVRFSRSDVADVERLTAETVSAILPEQQSPRPLLVAAGARVRRLYLSGADERYADFRAFEVLAGRFFDHREMERGSRVAVLGYEAAVELFDEPARAIGRLVTIDGQPFEVIGVPWRKGRQYFNTNRPDDRLVIVPIVAAEEFLGFDPKAASRILVYPRPGVGPDTALAAVVHHLGPRARFHVDDRSAYRAFDTASFTRLTDLLYAGFTVFVGIAGMITLLISAVGIANLHLANLSERTVEIGVCRTLGAKSRTIVIQTVCESLLVSGGASVLGVGLGVLLCVLLAAWVPADLYPVPVLSLSAVLVTGLAMVVVSLVAAFIPAMKARSIDLAVALREGV